MRITIQIEKNSNSKVKYSIKCAQQTNDLEILTWKKLIFSVKIFKKI